MCEVRDVTEAKKTIVYVLKDGTEGVTKPFYFTGKKALMEEEADNELAEEIFAASDIDINDVEKWHTRSFLEPGYIYISDHAMLRLKKRLGWKKSTAMRMVKKIYDVGEDKEGADNIVKRWLDYKEKTVSTPREGIYYRIYGQYIFIFDGQILVTAYNMSNPAAMRSLAAKHRRYNRAAFKRGESVC
ncbi:MAG: hypothetical protein ACI4CS_11835 [Candidatus Weimeria sp.]